MRNPLVCLKLMISDAHCLLLFNYLTCYQCLTQFLGQFSYMYPLSYMSTAADFSFLNAPFGDSDIENCECVMKSPVGKVTMKRLRYVIQDRVSRGPPPPIR